VAVIGTIFADHVVYTQSYVDHVHWRATFETISFRVIIYILQGIIHYSIRRICNNKTTEKTLQLLSKERPKKTDPPPGKIRN
jgi:hypothetical protein